LDQLEKLIVPTKTTKFCIWALQQGETGNFNEAKSSLFATLTRELEITPDQANAIRGHRYFKYYYYNNFLLLMRIKISVYKYLDICLFV
jgi:hypothetical protein